MRTDNATIIADSNGVSRGFAASRQGVRPSARRRTVRSVADPLLRHSVILGGGMALLNGASWLFHVIMSRTLGPADYGALNALIGLMLLLTVPANTLHMGVSTLVARLWAAREVGAIRSTVAGMLRYVFGFGVVACAVLMAASGLLAHALKLASPVPVVIAGTVLLGWTALPVLRGVLQGMHRFAALGASLVAEGIVKLGIGVGLVMLGFALNGAVVGISLGALGALLLTAAALRDRLQGPALATSEIRDIARHLAPYAVVIGCFTVLTQSDVVLVKALHDPVQAGIYAAASAGGKTVLYVTAALPMIALPEAARRHELDQDQRTALVRLLSIGALVGGALVTGFFLFPLHVIRLLFGASYLPASPLLGYIGLGMLAYQLATVTAYSQLASGNLRVTKPLGALAALFPVLVWVFRSNLIGVAVLIAVMGNLALLTVWRQGARERQRLEQSADAASP